MIGKIFGVISVASLICSFVTGNVRLLGQAVIDGTNAALELTASLAGVMCLWSGMANVLNYAGFTSLLSKLLYHFLKISFPTAYKHKNALNDIAADFSANLLGLGNAALPLGIKAMESLKQTGLPKNNSANDDMVMLAVMNTTPLQIMPTTLIALRNAAGSADPYGVILPIWICSVFTTIFAIVVCKMLSKVYKVDES